MMKKLMLNALVAAMMPVFLGTGFAQEVNTAQAQDWKEIATQKAHVDLSGKEWTVYIWSAETKGAFTTETDVLTFSSGKITSKNLLGQGYPASNYGLFIGDDGSVSFETMQAKELPDQVDLAFIRGSLANGVLSGSMVMQPQKGAKKKFIYSTQMPDEKAQKASVQAAQQPATQPVKRGRR